MKKKQYMQKIATIIVDMDNKQQKSFKPTKIHKKYNDPFEIQIFETMNDALNEMQENGYIVLKYASSHSNEIVKISIVKEKVSELAKVYSLTTNASVNDKVCNILSQYKSSPYIEILDFIQDQMERIQKNKAIQFVHNQSTDALEEVLAGCQAILSQEDDILLRELSIRTYNNSKILENRLPQILSVINKENVEKDIFLQQHNIFRNKTYALVKGNAIIYFKNGDRLTLSHQNKGSIQLSLELVNEITTIETASLLSIENLTSFESHLVQPTDGIILFLGGFSNNVNVEFIKKTNCPVYHFGDIDASGFKILHDLCKRTSRTIIRHKMDIDTIQKFAEYGKPIDEHNLKTLQQMLSSNEYSIEEKECFEMLIQLQKTIEQEIIK